MAKAKKLSRYRQMRQAGATAEPFSEHGSETGRTFVVQMHGATRLHYDLRLEIGGVLRSWAVPKGPSANPKDKRLAVSVEDHPVEYANFEGVIPKGNYGAGPVIVWDRGFWKPLEDLEEGFKKGKILFELNGHKLKGTWALVRLKKTEKDWLLIKERDAYADDESEYPSHSVFSGRELEDLLNDSKNDFKKVLSSLPPFNWDTLPMGPMLATREEKPFQKDGWSYEIKYDGYRIHAAKKNGEVTLYSRNGHNFSALFPELKHAVELLPYDNLILDGEVVVIGEEGRPNFNYLQQRVAFFKKATAKPSSLVYPLQFFAFDLIALEGKDLRDQTYKERRSLLDKVVPNLGVVRLSESFPNGVELFDRAMEMGLEGIVAKRLDSKYASLRSDSWIKVRGMITEDFVVLGYTEPKRGRVGFGALVLGTYEDQKLIYVGRVGTGFSDEELENIAADLKELEQDKAPIQVPEAEKNAHWVLPKIVVEVQYKERNEALRQPKFLRLRPDKTPFDCGEAPAPPAPQKKEPVVKLSNLDKVFWPKEGYTKGDLIEYYQEVSPYILPWLKDRPLVLTRYPDGIEGKSFYQKDAPVFVPEWVTLERVWSEHSQREIKYFLCNNAETLAYISNLGAIPLHIWASRSGKLHNPDWCILDLDPKEAPFKNVITIAKSAKKLCDDTKLPAFLKTSGSTGLHILIPLGGALTHDQSKMLGELLARCLVAELPKIATIARIPAKREGKVYIDYLQNGWGKLIAAPFCVRPREGASVSMTLSWSQLKSGLKPDGYTIKNALSHLKKRKDDPWKDLLTTKPDLAQALALLEERSKEPSK